MIVLPHVWSPALVITTDFCPQSGRRVRSGGFAGRESDPRFRFKKVREQDLFLHENLISSAIQGHISHNSLHPYTTKRIGHEEERESVARVRCADAEIGE